MFDRVLEELAAEGQAYVDTLDQAHRVLEAAADRWPEVSSLYGWDCLSEYDQNQKRWRFLLVCLSPWGTPSEN